MEMSWTTGGCSIEMRRVVMSLFLVLRRFSLDRILTAGRWQDFAYVSEASCVFCARRELD
jgi:hypothetical protein